MFVSSLKSDYVYVRDVAMWHEWERSAWNSCGFSHTNMQHSKTTMKDSNSNRSEYIQWSEKETDLFDNLGNEPLLNRAQELTMFWYKCESSR